MARIYANENFPFPVVEELRAIGTRRGDLARERQRRPSRSRSRSPGLRPSGLSKRSDRKVRGPGSCHREIGGRRRDQSHGRSRPGSHTRGPGRLSLCSEADGVELLSEDETDKLKSFCVWSQTARQDRRSEAVMAKIFLSYRREDSAGVAGRIYDRLRAHFGAGFRFHRRRFRSVGRGFPGTHRVGVKPVRRLPGRDRTRLGWANQHWSAYRRPERLGSD